MAAVYDPVTIVNLLFCIIIVFLGYMGYKKMDNAFPLYIGVAFGIFGISCNYPWICKLGSWFSTN